MPVKRPVVASGARLTLEKIWEISIGSGLIPSESRLIKLHSVVLLMRIRELWSGEVVASVVPVTSSRLSGVLF